MSSFQAYLQRGSMKHTNIYYQSKMFAIWPVMFLSLTLSLSSKPGCVVFNQAAIQLCRLRCFSPHTSSLHLLILERYPREAAVMQLLAASLAQHALHEQDWSLSLVLVVENVPTTHSVQGDTATMNHPKTHAFVVSETHTTRRGIPPEYPEALVPQLLFNCIFGKNIYI